MTPRFVAMRVKSFIHNDHRGFFIGSAMGHNHEPSATWASASSADEPF
jgi:hypothetical protein